MSEEISNSEEVKKWPCVMIDIETLGIENDAVILEVGAVAFTRDTQLKGPTFSGKVDMKSQRGRAIEADALEWWMAKEREERFRNLISHFPFGKMRLDNVIECLAMFLRLHLAEDGEVWVKGDFDLRILSHVYKANQKEEPWKYYQSRELRTVLKLAKIENGATTHAALEDANRQVEQLWEAEDKLRMIAIELIDFEKGYQQYRDSLAEMKAQLIPAWTTLSEDEKECWCAGVRTAVEANVKEHPTT